MIREPYAGQRVQLAYNERMRKAKGPWTLPRRAGTAGEIVLVARGPGPLNVLVRFPDAFVVVPRGNLVPESEKRGTLL